MAKKKAAVVDPIVEETPAEVTPVEEATDEITKEQICEFYGISDKEVFEWDFEKYWVKKEEAKVLETAFTAVESENPWENTVAMYTMEPKAICAMPAGVGVNFIMEDGVLPEEAEYLCNVYKRK